MNENTLLYQLTETSKYMMGFVIVTKKNNVVVIDGGRPADMPLLKQYIGGRRIAAWILTHAHEDHISGFIDKLERHGAEDFDIDKIYYNFPPYELINDKNVRDYEYHCAELNESLPSFNAILDKIKDKAVVVSQGDSITVDELKIDFIYSYPPGLTNNVLNDSSLVFKVVGEKQSVLFLGDLGPEGGDLLFRESRHLLRSDIVQMAHHGHMNVGFEVYAEIMPKACLWCCPMWLYNEPVVPEYLKDAERLIRMGRVRMYGTALTRKWMELLGVKTHYVSGEGTNCIII